MKKDILEPFIYNQIEATIKNRESNLRIIKHNIELLERVFDYIQWSNNQTIAYIYQNIEDFINPIMDSDITLLFKQAIFEMQNDPIIGNNVDLLVIYDYLKESYMRLNCKME